MFFLGSSGGMMWDSRAYSTVLQYATGRFILAFHTFQIYSKAWPTWTTCRGAALNGRDLIFVSRRHDDARSG